MNLISKPNGYEGTLIPYNIITNTTELEKHFGSRQHPAFDDINLWMLKEISTGLFPKIIFWESGEYARFTSSAKNLEIAQGSIMKGYFLSTKGMNNVIRL